MLWRTWHSSLFLCRRSCKKKAFVRYRVGFVPIFRTKGFLGKITTLHFVLKVSIIDKKEQMFEKRGEKCGAYNTAQ